MNLKDIAKLAGVSSVTVSNVINGNHNKVSKETIDKVNKIIKEHNYVPNATARSLASKKSRIIGVVLPYVGMDEDFSRSPYYTRILALLENYIRQQGYYMMIRCTGGCGEVIPLFNTWNVDGMIILGADKREVKEIIGSIRVPVVFIDTYAESKIANIGIDDYKGGYLAARYLLSKGHKHIGYAGPGIDSPGVIGNRIKGINDALAKKITAVVSMSDVLAFGIMEGLHLSGLVVPDDISVIGFDGLPECRYTTPHLTSVSQNLSRKALLAGEYLFKMIKDKKKIAVNEIVDVEIS